VYPKSEEEMAITSVKDVSKIVIQKATGPISNLKLQKLLYYVQGWSLALYDRLAFHEEIQAWVHGPVVPAAFYEYKHYRWNPIDVPTEAVEIPEDESAHIAEVLSVYGIFTATKLERISHEESPWKDARAGLEPTATSRAIITPASMKEYFSQLHG
jgi:uncharacterized phage-associated protein